MRPIVFLDIDDVIALDHNYSGKCVAEFFAGVTVSPEPDLWCRLFSTEAKKNLKELDSNFNPSYVISSSWCNYLKLEQIKEVFSKTGLDFIACNLHEQWRTPRLNNFGRLAEIESWIRQYMDFGQPLLILDDLESGWNLIGSTLDERGFVIFCNPSLGFDRDCFVRAVETVNRQIQLS